MEIFVCVGSACHKRGSYEVMKRIKALIGENNLGEKISVKSSFCLGKCKNGVSIKIDDKFVLGVSKDNIDEIFNQYVLEA